jgi:protein disulfide-isomerase
VGWRSITTERGAFVGDHVAACSYPFEFDREGFAMRRLGPTTILLLLCAMLASPALAQLPAFGASEQTSGVQWLSDLEAAKKLARETNRMVLVHFWTPSCGPCLNLDKTVFNQTSVSAALETKFVPVKLNANENSATAQGFGITRVPTDVILTPDGQVVGKLISPPTPAGYVAEVMQAAATYAATPGQTFANAAANAPMPSQLNAAYASLQVPPNTQPAIAEPTAGPTAATAGPATVTTNPQANPFVSSAGASPAGQLTNQFAQPAGATTATAGAVGIPPASASAVGFSPPPVSPPAASPPVQVANPYLGATASPAQPAMPQTSANAVAPMAEAPDARQLPPGSPPLGFEGYCPVSMRNQWKWVPGDPRWGIVHRGRTYWFAGEAEQKQFWADPDRYSPALSGMDPVMAIDHQQQVPGKREHSIDYDNLFYMFSSEATLAQFTANPERYAVGVRQAMGIPRGRLVR